MLVAILLALTAQCAQAAYSDAFTRNTLPIVFAATEAPQADDCLAKHFKNYKLKRHVVVKCDATKGVDTCSGLTMVSHDDKAIILAFRGTKGPLQLVVESNEILFKNKTQWYSGGMVGAYYAQSFDVVWNNGLKDALVELVGQYPTYTLIIGGHSLGGSMAALAASYVTLTGLVSASKVELITFGEPRTGDAQFASVIDKQIGSMYRVIHANDIVPHLPLKGIKGFTHHRNEIWYNNDMSKPDYVECDADESTKCSNSHLDFKVEDHHRYFGMFIAMYGRRGCTGDPSK